jgi:uncharacterized protein YcbX
VKASAQARKRSNGFILLGVTLESLSLFPVKSCGAVELVEAQVEARGLKYDRRWLVTDESGRFLTQREVPQLATIRPHIGQDTLELRCGDARLDVPLELHEGHTMRVQIWRDEVEAVRVGELADEWLRDVLGIDARLVWMPGEAKREVDARFAHKGEITSFADGFPFLVLTSASVDDLNERIAQNGGETIGAERFRSNFLIAGATPYDEDSWARFRIGQCEFEVVKPCSRCVIPTLDQATGERSAGEPLRTLATYRRTNGKIYLAQNALPRKMGRVRVGDEVEVLTRR